MSNIQRKTSTASSSANVLLDGTTTRESKATVSVDDGTGEPKTRTVSISNNDARAEDDTQGTDMNGSNSDTAGEDDTQGTGMNGSNSDTAGEDDTQGTGMNGSNSDTAGENDTQGTDMNGSNSDTAGENDTQGTDMNGSNSDTAGENDTQGTDMNGSNSDTAGENDTQGTDMNGSNSDTAGEDDTQGTGMNGSNSDTAGEDEADVITDLTNSAPQKDISEARQTESSQQQSLTIGSFINNGSFEGTSFEQGTFQNWRTIGDTSIETKEIGIAPTDGESQALITNGFSDAGGSVEESDLSEFLDLTSGSLDALLEGNATEGSGIKQSFTAQAGDILEFDYRLLTNEGTPSATFNDSAFFALGTSIGNFALELGDTSDSTFSENNGDDNKPVEGFFEATDGKTIRIAISEAGTYDLGFGIVDLTDTIVDSGILLDDVKLISSGIEAFSSPSVDGSVQNQTDGAISSEVDFTFGTNGFEAATDSSNPQ